MMLFSFIYFAVPLLSYPLLSSSAPLKHRRSGTLNPTIRRSSYAVVDTYQGENFFDDWSFFTDPDPTHGFVTYVSEETAQSTGLATVDGNGTAVIAVDSISSLPFGINRNSVRISTQKTYNEGLFIYDVSHLPTGCSTWPALWSTAVDGWPTYGEIDVIEGVHESTENQITMHTDAGCSLVTGPAIIGQVTGSTCASSNGNNNGCPTLDPNGWGTAFNAAGGGVFAELWDPSTGIQIWHFPRNSIPDDITSKDPDPSSWGTPVSFLPNGNSCDVADHFQNHQIIINISLCGDWAGATYSCGGTCQDAVMDPSNYIDAYWGINSVLVYQSS